MSMERAAIVRRFVAAARRLVVDVDRDALVRATGLSREGVDLALEHHLELEPSDEDLRSLVDRAGRARRVAVILSANVFVGALRAVAIARAASDEVIVRPSRREPVFARALVRAASDPAIVLDEAFDVASFDEGEIHVYGRDETIARVREAVGTRANDRVRVRGHGSGMGVAVVRSAADARALADDVVAFDQRGCLSPRVAVVLGDANAFADALHDALGALGRSVPRGEVPSEERAELRRYVDTMTYAGRVLVGHEHLVGTGDALVLPPTHRTVHVVPAASLDAAAALLAPFAKAIVTVGAAELDEARAVAPSWARVARLGAMQRPPLDGPVDLRAG
jgi:acyl-CoA reductase-like NAD-dependent aldehyde dehydrogenase